MTPARRRIVRANLGDGRAKWRGTMIRLLAFTALVLSACPSQATRAAEMTFYQLPAGAYPHDVAPAPDGTVWISGQRQGFAGKRSPSGPARGPTASSSALTAMPG